MCTGLGTLSALAIGVGSGLGGTGGGSSMIRASIGAGGTIAGRSGAAKKNPKPHNMAAHSTNAAGNGHQGYAFNAGVLIPAALFMCHRNQEMLRTGSACLQHGLHHHTLRRFAIG